MDFEHLYKTASDEDGALLLRQYLADGGDPDQIESVSKKTMLFNACEQMNTEWVTILGAAGANPNFQSDVDGWTPMHLAVDIDIDSVWQATHSDDPSLLTFTMVRAMLDIGGSLDIPDHKGRTPRQLAADYGRTDRLEEVLAAWRAVADFQS